MAKTVKITFDAFGQMSADATGFVGTACEDATRNILAGVATEVSNNKKPEYNMIAEAEQSTSGGLTLGTLG